MSKIILIVDDDPDIRTLATIILENEGYQVREACHGLEALQSQKCAPSDLWLLDVFMPHCDGLEAIKKVRKDHPDLPIICMSSASGDAEQDYTAIGKRFGANVSLAKPFEPEALLDAVIEALGKT